MTYYTKSSVCYFQFPLFSVLWTYWIMWWCFIVPCVCHSPNHVVIYFIMGPVITNVMRVSDRTIAPTSPSVSLSVSWSGCFGSNIVLDWFSSMKLMLIVPMKHWIMWPHPIITCRTYQNGLVHQHQSRSACPSFVPRWYSNIASLVPWVWVCEGSTIIFVPFIMTGRALCLLSSITV